jgi:hypothetical protein
MDFSSCYKKYVFFFFLEVPGFELRVLHFVRQALYHLSHSISPVFLLGIFEIGSYELSAQAGFKL